MSHFGYFWGLKSHSHQPAKPAAKRLFEIATQKKEFDGTANEPHQRDSPERLFAGANNPRPTKSAIAPCNDGSSGRGFQSSAAQVRRLSNRTGTPFSRTPVTDAAGGLPVKRSASHSETCAETSATGYGTFSRGIATPVSACSALSRSAIWTSWPPSR